jgi:hypothetical protein
VLSLRITTSTSFLLYVEGDEGRSQKSLLNDACRVFLHPPEQ